MGGVITNRELDASAAPRVGRDEADSPASAKSSSGETQTPTLDEFSVSQLRQFFELLDKLDRKAAEQTDDEDPSSTKAMQAAGGA